MLAVLHDRIDEQSGARLRRVGLRDLHPNVLALWVQFRIGIGAAALVGVYNLMGGNRFVSSLILGLDVAPIVIILVMMAIMLVLGLFLDWIGIAMLALPIFLPIVIQLGFDPIWFGILFAVNMQVSFLSPPFGPAAFYLKSVAPPDISLKDIYLSVLPFMAIQLCVLAALLMWPQLAIWPL